MTPAPISVERLRELLAKATPGPWVTDDELPGRVFSDDATGSIIAQFDGFRFAPRADDEMSANTHLAAAAVNALPTLLQQLAEREAEVERLQAELDFMTAHYERMTSHMVCHRGALIYANAGMRDAYSEEHVRAEAAERAREEACELLREAVPKIDALANIYYSEFSDGRAEKEATALHDRIAAYLAANDSRGQMGGGNG